MRLICNIFEKTVAVVVNKLRLRANHTDNRTWPCHLILFGHKYNFYTSNCLAFGEQKRIDYKSQFRSLETTRSSAIAEGPRDASCQLKFSQLPRNSAETTCTPSPEQIEVI